MSLRTKILAAVVGLNLAVLCFAVFVLLFRAEREDDVPVDLLRLVENVAKDPGDGPEARRERERTVDTVRASGPGVQTVIWMEESDDPMQRDPRPVPSPGVREPSAQDRARAVLLHHKARLLGQDLFYEGDLIVLLAGGRATLPGNDDAPLTPGRQSLYVRWVAETPDVRRARALYFTLLGGIVAVTTIAWVLLSRLVVRPLATLARAADRMASGDLSARVPASGAGDEIDRTAHAFNRMATEIAEHQGHLEDRVMAALSRVRKAEQHLAIAQRLAATGKLASGIAHEINNPLGGMRSAVKSLQRGDLEPAKTAEYLELVQDGLLRVEETVKKVLQFTPRTPTPKPTDLGTVARKASALARHRLDRRGVRYVERLPEAPVRVFGDAHELQQVVLNLLLNAADAIPDREASGATRDADRGVVDLEVREDGDTVVLTVRDDGVGMTPEVAAQCFDLFFTTKSVGEGTGLGLAVVHNIVTNHGGRIELETAPGQGTTFRVTLPRDTTTPDEAPGVGAAAGGGRAPTP